MIFAAYFIPKEYDFVSNPNTNPWPFMISVLIWDIPKGGDFISKKYECGVPDALLDLDYKITKYISDFNQDIWKKAELSLIFRKGWPQWGHNYGWWFEKIDRSSSRFSDREVEDIFNQMVSSFGFID